MPFRSRNLLHASRRPLARIFLLLAPLCLFIGVATVSAQTVVAYPPDDAILGEQVAPPVYVPLVMAGKSLTVTPGIRGRLDLGKIPFADANVTVRDCTHQPSPARFSVSATSDADGRYTASVEPDDFENGTPISLTLAFSTSTPITHSVSPTASVTALGSWKSACMPAGFWPELTLQALDLQAPVFVAPADGEVIDMPILFQWEGRTNPRAEETLLWQGSVQFDCGSCAPVEITATLQTSISTDLEWYEVTPCSQTNLDVKWVDYTLQVTNDLGTGKTLPRRTLVGATVYGCPPP